MKIKNFTQFISVNEMADYNETMTIEDLIYVLEQKPKDDFIVSMNEKLSNENKNGEIYFLLNDLVEIPSEGMKMENRNYQHSFSGKKYKFYTHNVETNSDNLLGITYIGNQERPDDVNLPPYKTIGELIEIAKRIPNPSKCLFFLPSRPTGYNMSNILTFENTFSSVRGLANRNIKSYPLTKNGKIVSGRIGEDNSEISAYQFMSMGYEQGGEYVLKNLKD